MDEMKKSEISEYSLPLLGGYGFEFEYMIVDKTTFSVKPICDVVLAEIAGHIANLVFPDGDNENAAWSNELALHVIEFKTNKPVSSLYGIPVFFQSQVEKVSDILEAFGARLMPTAMHPWMVPENEFRIWPHGSRDIYNRFDSIFGCKGHGWSNLQSLHINLSFSDSNEFRILHNAIRLLLPVMSGLTASSPFAEGKFTGFEDYRMEVYRTNSSIIPSITGLVVPESTAGINEYKKSVLSKIYMDLSPYDPEKIISYEWVNARGCIPRFDRGSIEIRTLDIQECPAADISCAELFIGLIRSLTEEKFISHKEQSEFPVESLYSIFIDTIKNGSGSIIKDRAFLGSFGLRSHCSVIEFWQYIAEKVLPAQSPAFNELNIIFLNGNLSTRILKKTGKSPDRSLLLQTYEELCECLYRGIQLR